MPIFKGFKADERGATAMIFGLAIIPVMGFVGSAIDYGRATSAQAQLQNAVDATALALVRDATVLNDAELKAKGETLAKALLKDARNLSIGAITVQKTAKTIKVAAAGTIKTAFLAMAGFDTIAIASQAQSTWGMNKIELALVLDNTGSMNEAPGGKRKMDALKTASRDLLGILRNVAIESDTVKVSIVPFDTEVRLETKYNTAEWLRWSNPADRLSWTGYVIDRDQPYDADDSAPDTKDKKTLYPAVKDPQWKAMGDIAPIRPLTSVYEKEGYDALDKTVDAMRPRANTNIAIGVAWGLATLSKSEPFAEAAPFGSGNLKKYMIVLTDGENTQNHIDGKVNNNVGKIDARTKLACKSADDAGVIVYTVRLVSGNASLLKDCASKTGKYYDVQDATQLGPVFQAIAKEISATRLSM